MPHAAVYLRVSTERQTTENQRADAEGLARARGFVPVVFEEVESAAKKRPVLERMLSEVRGGRFHAVVVVALDRLGRSMTGVVNTVLELDHLGVRVLSVREPWVDTTGPVRPLLLAIFGWVAEQERAVLIERTKAGQARARAQGKRIGRPRESPVLLGAAADAVEKGESIRRAASVVGVDPGTLRRFLRTRQARPAPVPESASKPPSRPAREAHEKSRG